MSFYAAARLGVPNPVTSRTRNLVSMRDEARRLIALHCDTRRLNQSKLNKLLDRLATSYVLKPGVLSESKLDAAVQRLLQMQPDDQYEKYQGREGLFIKLRDAKEKRKVAGGVGYLRPCRWHLGMSLDCGWAQPQSNGLPVSFAELSFYGKAWTTEPKFLEMRQ